MTIRFALTGLFAVTGLVAAALPADARINKRQTHQQTRISKGIGNGSLTARETNRLQKQQGRIAAYEAQSRADGPGLTRHERARMKVMQDRASANIYHQKHDRQRAN